MAPQIQKNSGVTRGEGICFATLHGAKGLEFRHVFIVACKEALLPARFALKSAANDADKEIVTRRERNLLYVSMTRARDQVWITWTGNPSPFLQLVEPLAESVIENTAD